MDNRDAALKGGHSNSDNIVPGNSVGSKLIHYVAGLDEEMTMPPPGKTRALSAEEIALLRAWIDQGANWGIGAVLPESSASATLGFRWIDVAGDSARFREMTGWREGFGGGVEEFAVEQRISPDTTAKAEGRVLFPEDDVRLKLSWEKADFGFIRTGFEMWRRYYDDSGGCFPGSAPPQFELNRDLYLDVGRAWFDLGLTLPNFPKIVLGYELQFRDGTKSMLEWGKVNGKNIYPATKGIDERVHILKLDVEHEVGGWRFQDSARVEFYRSEIRREQITTYTAGPAPDGRIRTREKFDHVNGANIFSVEKQINDFWFASAGYLYSRMEGDSTLNQTTVNAQNAPAFGFHWSDDVTLRREMHAASISTLVVPLPGLSLSAGVQSQFSRQEGFGRVNLDLGDPSIPGSMFLAPGQVRSDLDQSKFSENAGLKFTRIPFTILFADAKLEQDCIGQFERETGSTADVFLRDTDYEHDRKDARAGINVSPWRWLSLHSHYRVRHSASDYDHRRDESLANGLGYSAFIRERDIRSDEIEAKLTLHPARWLKATLSYRRSDADFRVTTDPVNDAFLGNLSPGGERLAGETRADSWGGTMTWIPVQRCFLSGTFQLTDSRTVSADDEAPFVVPYNGRTCSVIGSGNYALNDRVSLMASYAFVQSKYARNDVLPGVPLGLDFEQHRVTGGVEWRLNERVRSALRYTYFDFNESSSAGRNDFTAHGLFATVTVAWSK